MLHFAEMLPLMPLEDALVEAETLPGGVASQGSVGHALGNCRPCAWEPKPGGCSKGQACEFCHLCDEGELKKRRKERLVSLKENRKKRMMERKARGKNKTMAVALPLGPVSALPVAKPPGLVLQGELSENEVFEDEAHDSRKESQLDEESLASRLGILLGAKPPGLVLQGKLSEQEALAEGADALAHESRKESRLDAESLASTHMQDKDSEDDTVSTAASSEKEAPLTPTKSGQPDFDFVIPMPVMLYRTRCGTLYMSPARRERRELPMDDQR